ncbi:hypothetical protein P692DRAFT_201335705 [Suillus brevipes Sb2]|nr:hypothetical protein P692DRAFT_201335705 [Suillus brevipes Sb2]
MPTTDARNAMMGRLRPTYVWITAHLVLCSRSRLPFYRRFQNISLAGPARNRAKRCIVLRSAGTALSADNEYVRTAEPRTLVETAVWAIHTKSHSVPDMKNCIGCYIDVPENTLDASVGG